MNHNRPILVIITGGTIDAEAYPDPANPPQKAAMLAESAVPAALAAMHLARPYYCYLWLRKDSKDFTEADIQGLAQVIRASGHRDIVITHGTDKMVENSRLLDNVISEWGHAPIPPASRLALLGSQQQNDPFYKIAFTGAMMPLSNGAQSDGYRNLRYAMEQVGSFPPGVWIAFENQRFEPHRTVKDFETYRFTQMP